MKGVTTVSRFFFFFQAEDGIRDIGVTGVQTCALPILTPGPTVATTAKSAEVPVLRSIENPSGASIALSIHVKVSGPALTSQYPARSARSRNPATLARGCHEDPTDDPARRLMFSSRPSRPTSEQRAGGTSAGFVLPRDRPAQNHHEVHHLDAASHLRTVGTSGPGAGWRRVSRSAKPRAAINSERRRSRSEGIKRTHSMTSSALSSSDGGIVRPR